LLAQKDPLWIICTDPGRKDGKWDTEAFFRTGEEEVNMVLDYIKKVGLTVDFKSPLLDFGCGVGRLTQAFARSFEQCYGVDISSTMIKYAQAYNRYPQRCFYQLNKKEDLKIFQDDFFGFIYTSLVLQHIKPALSTLYLKEYALVLKRGGVAVVQLVDHDNSTVFRRFKRAARIRTRAKAFVRKFIFQEREKEAAISMYYLSEKKVRVLAKGTNIAIADAIYTNSTDKDFNGKLRYSAAAASSGYVSKQYIFTKR
jgi:ubiquinone/menaquinone biosynthesis C-methylase UbiE